MIDKSNHPDYELVCRMYVTINGKRVRRANGRPFCFYVKKR